MRLLFPALTCLGLLAALAFFLAHPPGPAVGQQPAAPGAGAVNKEEVKFDTYDGVELHGTFYPGGKADKSPCVLLVTKVGANRQQAGWEDLAVALQNQGYSVLSFDFRGCNDSQNLSDARTFWSQAPNVALIRGARGAVISYKEFSPSYLPTLANDIAAAKYYLNQRNNARDCNSAELSIVGAEDGAAIAALWINSEWRRRRLVPNGFGGFQYSNTMEGEDINSAFWLTITPTLAGVQTASFLTAPVNDKVPMVFAFSKPDARASSTAKTLVSYFKNRKVGNLSAELGLGVAGAGAELLNKNDPARNESVNDDIVHYLDRVKKTRTTNVWSQRNDLPIANANNRIPLGMWYPYPYTR